jgi:hypothetical protein
MDTADIKTLVTSQAPSLAGVLGGADAPMALAALGRSLVGDDQASPDVVAKALSSADPDVALRVRQAEESLLSRLDRASTSLAQLNAGARGSGGGTVQRDQAAALDRQQARQRQTRSNDKTNGWLAIITTTGFFVILLFVIGAPYVLRVPAVSNPVAETLLGVLGTGWVAVISYYFGSSVGSKEKTALFGESMAPPADKSKL